MISLAWQAIKELTIKNEKLEKRLQKLEGGTL